MANDTRRAFLGKAGAGAAAIAWAGAVNVLGANEKVNVGLIGCGGRGSGVAQSMGGVTWVCDPDRGRLGGAAKRFGLAADHAVTDLRRMLDDKALDAVVIATCDHWHAPAGLLAMEAGKHAYIEKPISHNYRESQLLVATARRTKRVVQHGTQSRSMPLVAGAMQMLREGLIGTVLMSKAWNIQHRRNIGHGTPSDPPKTLDYDTWVGPAAWMPFQENRFHYNWHWWHNFGTGDMGNDGTHEIDYARWGLGVDALPTRVAGLGTKLFFNDDQQFPDTMTVAFDYAADNTVGARRQLLFEMRIWSPTRPFGVDNGAEFYGTEGKLCVSKRGWVKAFDRRNREVKVEPEPPEGLTSHHENFLDAVRGDAAPHAGVETAHRSVALVHLGNIACRLGRTLRFDPATETIVGDDEAATFLGRAYRKGGHWAIPKGAQKG